MNATNEVRELVGTGAVARHLGISPGTVRRLAKSGMPAVRITDRTIRFDLAAVNRWLERRNTGAEIEANA